VKLSECRSCHAPIVWTTTSNGKRMPVDADPIALPHGFRLSDIEGQFEGDGEEAQLATFVAACPNATQHRRSA